MTQLEGLSLPLVSSCWVYSVVYSAGQGLTRPETPPGFGWLGSGWDELFYVSMTEYNDYVRNKAVGQVCLTFCVSTDKVFGEAVSSKFPFQLSLHQCNYSDPMNHWFVCIIKHLKSCENSLLFLVTQTQEENVVLRACPTTVTERCLYRDWLFTDGSADVTVTASDRPVLSVLNYLAYVGKELEEDCSNRHVATFSLTWFCLTTCMATGCIIHQEKPIRPHFLGTLVFFILLYNLFSHPAKLLHLDAVVLLLLVCQ